MITIKNVTKVFQETTALDHISFSIPDAAVFGLLGTNGAGKSTLLSILAGVLRPDEGSVSFDGLQIYDNLEVKRQIFYLPDEVWYPENASIDTMQRFYAGMYERFDEDSFAVLLEQLELRRESKIRTLSKGMKKQAFILMAICAGTRYILCDEVFDGLDAVVSETIKRFIFDITRHRRVTFVMASHDLHELQGICGQYVLVHRGRVITGEELEKTDTQMQGIHKIQCVFSEDQEEYLRSKLKVISYERTGIFTTLLVDGMQERTGQVIADRQPICQSMIPLTLEEKFMYEVKKVRNDVF